MMADSGLDSTNRVEITEIAPIAKDPNLRRIKVGSKVVAQLPAREVELLELTVGKRWTNRLAAQIEDALIRSKARRAAMTMLGRRALSQGELIERLNRRRFPIEVAARVTDELVADHWLDDTAYATAIAEELVRSKAAAEPFIVEKLVHRKIDESLARKVAQCVLRKVDPVDAAVEFAQKRIATMTQVSSNQAARRIAGALARRGFDEETIEAALRRLRFSLD